MCEFLTVGVGDTVEFYVLLNVFGIVYQGEFPIEVLFITILKCNGKWVYLKCLGLT